MTTKLNLSQNALTVLQKRYLKRNENGEIIETPEDLFGRVARHVASADALYGKTESEIKHVEEEFYELMTSLIFLPNSPTLMNAGRRLGQLSACFVIPVDDSMESIFDAVKYAAIIHKSGGGTGFSFSRLRPKGDVVGSTKGISSGPVSFMTVFDTATDTVKQGGTRRGANMGMLRVDHPDILEFITCKDNNNRLNNFNISIGLTNAFMKAVEEDNEYDLINPRTKKTAGKLNARAVFETIVKQAWKNGEPGIVFLDRINASNPTPMLGEIESTNPCGEQPLLPYESCNLGSINIAKFVKNGSIDWSHLEKTVQLAVHFLDNVIDVNKYPIKMTEEITKANRKIGLGIMGWADALIQLGIPYNSEQAYALAEEVMQFIQETGRKKSISLAEKEGRGVFPNWDKSIWKEKGLKVRNATITTIAPTGSISIIAGCSSGIEPLFALAYERNVLEGTRITEINPYFQKALDNIKLYIDDTLLKKINEHGSIQNTELPEDIKRIFVTAHDISPTDHIKMQAAFQKYTDNAVSKTVNLPHSATPEDIKNIYMLAYKLGCKGVTVYRDGSRDEQVLSTGKTKTIKGSATIIEPKKRPSKVSGTTCLLKTGCGNAYITINEDENGRPFEVFINMGKAGGCASAQCESIGRLVSYLLRINADPAEIVKQLKGISCHRPGWNKGVKVESCPDAIAKAIEDYTPLKAIVSDAPIPLFNKNNKYKEIKHSGACPECGGTLEYEGGCSVCTSCGMSDCS